VVAAAATALAGLGNGRWSLDRLLRRKDRSGTANALGAAILGVASAAALLAASYRPNEKESEPAAEGDAAPVDDGEE